nr:uncharacterized protein LOC101247268 [Solanum lycopersicum]
MASKTNEGVVSSVVLTPIFGGTDFEYWKIRMRTHLKTEGLWTIVANGLEEPDNDGDLTAVEMKNIEASNEWYVDNGCNNHMTGDEKAFLSINNSITTKVKMGNGALVDAKGKGTISINMKGSGKCPTKALKDKTPVEALSGIKPSVAANEKFRKYDGEKKVNSSLYKSLIGSLLYANSRRPYIMFSASLLSRFMQESSQVHFGAAKRVLHYLQGKMDYGIMYKFGGYLNLIGYFDSDWAGSIDDMSTFGYTFLFGSSICSWLSKKESVVAQSTAELEYVPTSKATSQAIWLRRIFEDIGEKTKKKDCYVFVITNQQLQLPRIQSAMKDQSMFSSSIFLSKKYKRKAKCSCIIVRQEC